MIKGFGIFSFLVFLMLCTQIGEFGPGFGIWFLSFLLITSGLAADALFLFPKSFERHGFKKLLVFADRNPETLVTTIAEIAEVVRKDGLLATEGLRKDLKDPWLVYALKKMMDGHEKSVIVQVIRNEHLHFHEQFLNLEKYKERLSNSIPLFGLVGSLAHLIHFLAKDDPSLIAASFIPFLLSILLQILFNAWAQGNIDFLTDQHRSYYAVLENGVSGIQDGVNAEVLRDQLMARIDHA